MSPWADNLAGPPAAENIPRALAAWLGPCDATASGSEEAAVQLARGQEEIALCGHHFGELELTLAAAGWQITHDNRDR